MSNIFGRIVVSLIFCCSALALSAQVNNNTILPKDNSPFSRFGLGDFANPYSTAQNAMGGVGIGIIESYFFNPANPAALAYQVHTSFEAALNVGNSSWTTSSGENNNLWTGNLQYLSIGFPLQNPINQAIENRSPDFSWGMNFNLRPYTTVGYDIRVPGTIEEYGDYTNILKGTGGTYQLNWANGWRYKNLSFGINTSYYFGKITNSRRVSLDDFSLYAYATEFLDEYSISGFQFKGGLQYVIKLDQDIEREAARNTQRRRIIIGATAGNTANFNTNVNRFYTRDNFGLREFESDTLVNQSDIKLTGQLPMSYGFGLTYENINKFRISAEYSAASWNEYQNEARPDQLFNSYRTAIGAEWIPNANSFTGGLARWRYRIGAFMGTDPRSFNGNQLDTRGVTLGVGVPIITPRQAMSFIHFSIEAGQISAGDLLENNYIQASLGFSLNDNTWFFKRKFN
jgi:hypothetical protein